MYFTDRKEAGLKLAEKLLQYKDKDVVVFALPRGGVVLGVEIAKELHAPLDLMITKKIGHPYNPEYAICAVGESGTPICNPRELESVDKLWFHTEVDRIQGEIERRKEAYHIGNIGTSPGSLKGKIAILVDDGIATGLTMKAAIYEARLRNPDKIVVAVPVTPSDTAEELKAEADELVSVLIDENYLGAVGAYYMNFYQVDDNEVLDLLSQVKIGHDSKM